MARYNVIGTMSGTSLDGLDIAYCSFEFSGNNWTYKIIEAQTINFPTNLKDNLKSAIDMSGLNLMKLHNELGQFIGQSTAAFIKQKKIDQTEIDCISSHGHTVFHQPELNLTTQIGNGANISAITRLPVICDFRTTDVALGGQGAPLVPIGDKLLFSEHDICINLGGIANISFSRNSERIAYDTCPVNIVLNKLAQELGFEYDKAGKIAESGKVDTNLLVELNRLSYYQELHPKSLGIEWIENEVFPIINASTNSIENKLCTFIEHISLQIANNIKGNDKTLLLSGGGTFNSYLVKRIKANTSNKIIIPSIQIIDFKEALIFAYLGVLRLRNETNCLSSVTGASSDNIGGCIYQAF
tara:strand:- start:1745 stop:2812 length:1068 start_codon:yes stop_codon:yes gene_type:complete